MYRVETRDFYEDLRSKPGFIEKFDTSNLPSEHPCYSLDNKKVPDTFTDETWKEECKKK